MTPEGYAAAFRAADLGLNDLLSETVSEATEALAGMATDIARRRRHGEGDGPAGIAR